MTQPCNLGDLIPPDIAPERIAIISLDADMAERTYTYGQLDATARAVARGLLARGLKRGDRVAILAANSGDYLAACFGIMRAGLVAVPVNFKFPRELIDFVVRDSGAALVFCDAEREAACPAGVPHVTFGRQGPDGLDALLDPGDFETVVPRPDEPAMFLYTSGSTGRPKGVVLSHQSHLWVVRTRLAERSIADERYLIAAPLYHMNALALSQLACAGGASMVLLPQFTARNYLLAISRYRCTWLTSVPPMIAMLFQEKELLAQSDLSSVRNLRMGSAPVSESLLAKIHELLPDAAVTNAYGTTEGGPVVFGRHPDGLPTPPLSVGYPHPQVQVRLRPGPQDPPDTGVLELRSPAIMLGYHNRPDLARPITGDGYYITGDVFRRDENGFYYFVGRADDMFVSGGENIFPGEVEKMLEQHPAVQQACVVPVDDEIKGQKPVAFLVAVPGVQPPGEDEIKRYALAHAPAYQHPRRVWWLDALPLASTNKIDRKLLKDMAARRVAGGEAAGAGLVRT